MEFTSLGELLRSNPEQDDADSRHGKRDIDYVIFDRSVDDNEMACGGRKKLDRLLRQKEVVAKPCGECLVRSSCLIGLGS